MAEVERPVIPVIQEDSRMIAQVRPGGGSRGVIEALQEHVSWTRDTGVHTDSSLSRDPGEPEVQDHPPDVQHAADLPTINSACDARVKGSIDQSIHQH